VWFFSEPIRNRGQGRGSEPGGGSYEGHWKRHSEGNFHCQHGGGGNCYKGEGWVKLRAVTSLNCDTEVDLEKELGFSTLAAIGTQSRKRCRYRFTGEIINKNKKKRDTMERNT